MLSEQPIKQFCFFFFFIASSSSAKTSTNLSGFFETENFPDNLVLEATIIQYLVLEKVPARDTAFKIRAIR